MVALTRLPVFVAARIARIQEAFTPVWPGRKFHELTGQRPARLTAPPQRGHNSHVWRVQTQTGEELKLYRFDHGQSAGQMVKLLSLLRESGFRVPSVLEFDDAEGWVIAEWIAGAPLTLEAMQDRKSLEEVAGFQASLNQVALPRAQFQRRFSYFHHLVFERYLHWTGKRFGSLVAATNAELAARVFERWPVVPDVSSLVLTDPDFSLDNLVRDADGKLALIDTEFLTADSSAAFEHANFIERTSRVSHRFAESYLHAYGKFGRTHDYTDEKSFWDACVALKQVGKQAMNFRASEADLRRRIESIGEIICAK